MDKITDKLHLNPAFRDWLFDCDPSDKLNKEVNSNSRNENNGNADVDTKTNYNNNGSIIQNESTTYKNSDSTTQKQKQQISFTEFGNKINNIDSSIYSTRQKITAFLYLNVVAFLWMIIYWSPLILKKWRDDVGNSEADVSVWYYCSAVIVFTIYTLSYYLSQWPRLMLLLPPCLGFAVGFALYLNEHIADNLTGIYLLLFSSFLYNNPIIINFMKSSKIQPGLINYVSEYILIYIYGGNLFTAVVLPQVYQAGRLLFVKFSLGILGFIVLYIVLIMWLVSREFADSSQVQSEKKLQEVEMKKHALEKIKVYYLAKFFTFYKHDLLYLDVNNSSIDAEHFDRISRILFEHNMDTGITSKIYVITEMHNQYVKSTTGRFAKSYYLYLYICAFCITLTYVYPLILPYYLALRYDYDVEQIGLFIVESILIVITIVYLWNFVLFRLRESPKYSYLFKNPYLTLIYLSCLVVAYQFLFYANAYTLVVGYVAMRILTSKLTVEPLSLITETFNTSISLELNSLTSLAVGSTYLVLCLLTGYLLTFNEIYIFEVLMGLCFVIAVYLYWTVWEDYMSMFEYIVKDKEQKRHIGIYGFMKLYDYSILVKYINFMEHNVTIEEDDERRENIRYEELSN